MKDQPTFFDFAAEVGLTKHIGGIAATKALIEQCQIGRESTVLDVGCNEADVRREKHHETFVRLD